MQLKACTAISCPAINYLQCDGVALGQRQSVNQYSQPIRQCGSEAARQRGSQATNVPRRAAHRKTWRCLLPLDAFFCCCFFCCCCCCSFCNFWQHVTGLIFPVEALTCVAGALGVGNQCQCFAWIAIAIAALKVCHAARMLIIVNQAMIKL